MPELGQRGGGPGEREGDGGDRARAPGRRPDDGSARADIRATSRASGAGRRAAGRARPQEPGQHGRHGEADESGDDQAGTQRQERGA